MENHHFSRSQISQIALKPTMSAATWEDATAHCLNFHLQHFAV